MSYSSNTLTLTEVHISKAIKPDKLLPKNIQDLHIAQNHISKVNNFLNDIDCVVVELPHGSQSARAMASYGICVGLVASINKPLLITKPSEIKKYVSGRNDTSKKEIINWVNTKHPNILDKRLTVAEHQADAVLAAYCQLTHLHKLQEQLCY